jgi:hypothetical protein
MKRLTALLLVTLMLWAAATPAEEAPLPDAQDLMLKMSDGVRLATMVWLPGPAKEGPWPVILERTPYNYTTAAVFKLFEFHKKGYAVVAQNIRGTGPSEGEAVAFGSNGWGGPGERDGVDTVRWIREQPWCNGTLGAAGFSASGITAHLLIAAAPEGLVCAYINAAPDNLYEWYYPGGALRVPYREGEEAAQAVIATHPTYDAFWQQRNARERHGVSNIPVYILGGWFDSFQRGSAAFFQGQHNNGLFPSTGNCKLHLYPTAHAAPPGELEFPLAEGENPDATIGTLFEWFDYWLKGADNGILDKPAVALFVMKDKEAPDAFGNQYVYAENWPPATRPLPLYLNEGGSLTLEPPQAPESSTSYAYDPEDPAPKIGGRNVFPPSGPHDQRETEARDDVIVFETAALTGDVTIIGTITATLFASVDAADADISVRLTDVYPDGRSMLMNDGILRASYRTSATQPEAILPGEVYELGVDLGDTALTFAAGHRIRIAIAGADSRCCFPSPDTYNTAIFHDAAHPSHITLPLWNSEGRAAL